MSPLRRARSWALRLLEEQTTRFWSTLDADAVRLFQGGMYTLTFIAALYMTAFGIPRTLDLALEDHVQDVWLLLNLAGPPMVLLGVRLARTDTNAWKGLVLQGMGNVGLGFAYGGFVLGVLQENWGSGVYAPFLMSGLSAWSLLLGVRDIRKLIGVEKQIRK